MKAIVKTGILLATVTVTLLLVSFTLAGSLYDIAVKDIDGRSLDLNNYRGKKMMFIILSGSEPDSIMNQYSLFCNKHKDSLVIVGISSLEDGYTEANKAVVKKRFHNNNLSFLLTEAMYTRKASGAQQSQLMQWLTNKNLNTHFDQDVRGTGHKFFVDETGELYAVMPPEAPLTHPIFERIINRPKKNHSN